MAAGKQKREPKSAVVPFSRKVRVAEDPDSLETQTISWHFHRLDWEHAQWGFKLLRPTQWRDLLSHLVSFEGLTWAEIKQQSGGRSHGTNHHSLYVSDLCKDAQDRLLELRLEEYDVIFSLRLTNTLRIYGIRDGRVLRLIWWDQYHGTRNGVYITVDS